MGAFEQAMQRLRNISEALNAVDLQLAAQLLAEHDRELRLVLEGNEAPLARAEGEMLHNVQIELLGQLVSAKERIERESQQARRGGAAARAYLGAAGG